MNTAIIFDIQRNSFVDGPGIRTTVFFKGCNLKCKWCHNPESQSSKPQIMFYKDKCTGCGKVYDINMPTLPDLNAKAQQYESDIKISGHTIMFYGVCPCCKS